MFDSSYLSVAAGVLGEKIITRRRERKVSPVWTRSENTARISSYIRSVISYHYDGDVRPLLLVSAGALSLLFLSFTPSKKKSEVP